MFINLNLKFVLLFLLFLFVFSKSSNLKYHAHTYCTIGVSFSRKKTLKDLKGTYQKSLSSIL